MRTTPAVQRVLRAMLEDPSLEHYGLELLRATKLQSGTIYPILGRLERHGWVESRWEEIDASTEGRPRRRLYRLTPSGIAHARAALVETASMLGFRPAEGFT